MSEGEHDLGDASLDEGCPLAFDVLPKLSPCSPTAFRQDDAGDLLAEDVGIEVSPRLIRLNEHERWRQGQSPKSHRDAGRAAHVPIAMLAMPGLSSGSSLISSLSSGGSADITKPRTAKVKWVRHPPELETSPVSRSERR